MIPAADVLSVSEVRILMVGGPANLLALEAILAGPECCLVRALSGEQALGLLAKGDFALVLLDLPVPGLDGFQTAKRARTSERSRDTPIIFLTASGASDFPLI